MPPLSDRTAAVLSKAGQAKDADPVWKGPCSEGRNGGVTQSMLGKYLVCKERFRIYAMEGWGPADQFNHRLHYGEMWHRCEEALAGYDGPRNDHDLTAWWQGALLTYAKALSRRYGSQQDQVEHWYQVCKTQFPVYVEHWKKDPDEKRRTPLLQEQVFDVAYALPSGRTVRLRGKWDSVDLIKEAYKAGKKGIWLKENKTKGDVDGEMLVRQLSFDLQTMIYLVALYQNSAQVVGGEWANQFHKAMATAPLMGVRYNVIRRPLSGGKGSIVRHKARGSTPEETYEAYYKRLGSVIEGMPHEFFYRWKCEVSSRDIETFKTEFLNPELENLCDDYEWWDYCANMPKDVRLHPHDEVFNYTNREKLFPGHRRRHAVMPHGVYNSLLEIGSHELDEYRRSGSTAGLERKTTLFPELE